MTNKLVGLSPNERRLLLAALISAERASGLSLFTPEEINRVTRKLQAKKDNTYEKHRKDEQSLEGILRLKIWKLENRLKYWTDLADTIVENFKPEPHSQSDTSPHTEEERQ